MNIKMAQKIVDKISQSMKYAITIVDLDGTIIASGDKSRIGKIHSVAAKMVQEKKEIDVISSSGIVENAGPGVCVTVCYDGKAMGVIEISGNPEETLGMGYIVKMSAETIIEYEFFKEKIRIRSNKKEGFLNALLSETDISEEELRRMAEGMGIDIALPRAAILISCRHTEDMEKQSSQILRTLTENPLHSHQDITTMTPEGDILIFKIVEKGIKRSVSNFKVDISAYCEGAGELLRRKYGLSELHFYVGTLQADINYYKLSYQHGLWLKNYSMRLYGEQESLLFFVDEIGAYMQSQTPPSVFVPIFQVYAQAMSEEEKRTLIEIGEALYRSQMSLTQCAKILYIHRNTLTTKMNKIKKEFGIDPVNNMSEQQFFLLFVYFLKNSQKHI